MLVNWVVTQGSHKIHPIIMEKFDASRYLRCLRRITLRFPNHYTVWNEARRLGRRPTQTGTERDTMYVCICVYVLVCI